MNAQPQLYVLAVNKTRVCVSFFVDNIRYLNSDHLGREEDELLDSTWSQ